MAASLPNEPDNLLIADELRHRREKLVIQDLRAPDVARRQRGRLSGLRTEKTSVQVTGRAVHSEVLGTE
jgi:hypothetical protein